MWPKGPCLYVLWRAGRVVYIGTTRHLPKRLGEHARGEGKTPRKAFDRVSWLDGMTEPEIESVESELVSKYRPVHNKTTDGKLGGRARIGLLDRLSMTR